MVDNDINVKDAMNSSFGKIRASHLANKEFGLKNGL